MSTIGNVKYVDANAFRFDSKQTNNRERNGLGDVFAENDNEVNLGK